MSDHLATNAREIVRRLQAAGHEAYWVGGCVRDLQLGREPKDYDIATSARPEQIEAVFPHCIPVGRQFGVIVVVVDQQQFQVATFRVEAEYEDGRRPNRVAFASAREDALRRDFTINGLFLDPVSGQMHDWVGGVEDIQLRRLRAIGNPNERFAEDHLRLLRTARLAAQLDLAIEPETLRAVQTLAPLIQKVSAERIRDELIKLLAFPHAARGLDLLRDTGLLAQVLPEVAAFIGCEQSPDHHPEGDVFQHVRLMLASLRAGDHELLPWAVLLHDIAKPTTATTDADGKRHFYGHEREGEAMAEAIMLRLKFPRRDIQMIKDCVLHHMKFHHARVMRKGTLRRALRRPYIDLELELHRLDCLASHKDLTTYDFMRAELAELADSPAGQPPLLTGRDLIELGMTPGPEMGRLLAEARELQWLDELRDAAAAREWARRRVGRTPKATG